MGVRGKVLTTLAGIVQVGLLVAALRDLRHRDRSELTAPPRVWALACGVNFIGPIAYFIWGRRK